jgi:hypothetical protein
VGPTDDKDADAETDKGSDTDVASGAYAASADTVASRQVSGVESSHADILEQAGDLSDPQERQRVVAAMKALEDEQRHETREKAAELGLPMRIEHEDGTVQELMWFENGQPVYYTTHNENAAISTGVHWLQDAPYELDGAGGVIGVWDSGMVRTSHQEFEGRVENVDSIIVTNHATHVA